MKRNESLTRKSPFDEWGRPMKYTFTYEELKPLIDVVCREPLPPEKHFPGINAIMDRLMDIREDNRCCQTTQNLDVESSKQ